MKNLNDLNGMTRWKVTVLVIAFTSHPVHAKFDEFYHNADFCTAVLRVLENKTAQSNPIALMRANKLAVMPSQPIDEHFNTGVDKEHMISPGGYKTFGEIAPATGSASKPVAADNNTVGGLLHEALSAVTEQGPGKAPRGLAQHFSKDEAKAFMDEVRSELKEVEANGKRALKRETVYILSENNVRDRKILAPLDAAYWAGLGGMAGSAIGGFLGDPVSGAQFGIGLGAMARLALAYKGILPVGTKHPMDVLQKDYTVTQFNSDVHNGKSGSILLQDKKTGLKTFMNWDKEGDGLTVYTWYPKDSGRRMDWVLKARHHEADDHGTDEKSDTESDVDSEPASKTAKAEPKVEVALSPAEVEARAREALGDYQTPRFRNGDVLALTKAKQLEILLEQLPEEFIEREELIEAFRLILLANGNLLMLGPAGTAKTRFAQAVGEAFVDQDGKSSFYKPPAGNSETNLTDLFGPPDISKMNKTGKVDRIWEDGLLDHHFGFVDETFNMPMRALNYLLTAMSDRSLGHHKGKLKTLMGATNKFLPQLFEKYGDDEARPFLDRWGAIVYVPNGFKSLENQMKLYEKMPNPKLPKVEIETLETLQGEIDHVRVPSSVKGALTILFNRMKADTETHEASEGKKYRLALANGELPDPPYRSNRAYTNRTQRNDLRMLQTIVVDRSLRKDGKDPLVANLWDLQKLRSVYTVTGLEPQDLEQRLSVANSPFERTQLKSMKKDRELFEMHLPVILNTINANPEVQQIRGLEARAQFSVDSLELKDEVTKFVEALRKKQPDGNMPLEKYSETEVAHTHALERALALLDKLVQK